MQGHCMRPERPQPVRLSRGDSCVPVDGSPWRIRKAAFVLSTGRTATQTIARVFNTFDDVTALHQPRPYRRFRIESCKAVCRRIGHIQLRSRFLTLRDRLLRRVTTPIYLESNNYLFGFGSVLEEVFDSPLLFHIVRHPFSFIESELNFGGYSGLKRMMLDYFPYWTIKPEHFGEPGLRWRSMSRFEKYAWVWTVTNRCLDELAQTTANYHRIRFEQLFDEECSGLQQIAEAVGLQRKHEGLRRFRDYRFNSSHARLVPAWQQWDGELRQQLADICGAEAEEYGYSLKP